MKDLAVALYMSAWIEIAYGPNDGGPIGMVALYMSAWIEITLARLTEAPKVGRTL